jgi:hypothetical protein
MLSVQITSVTASFKKMLSSSLQNKFLQEMEILFSIKYHNISTGYKNYYIHYDAAVYKTTAQLSDRLYFSYTYQLSVPQIWLVHLRLWYTNHDKHSLRIRSVNYNEGIFGNFYCEDGQVSVAVTLMSGMFIYFQITFNNFTFSQLSSSSSHLDFSCCMGLPIAVTAA